MTLAADAIRVYHTGATSLGAAQADASMSVGGFLSATPAHSLAHRHENAIHGVRVLFVSGSCGDGQGELIALDADTLRWRAPGDTLGASVAIANGETKTLFSGDDEKWISVRRETSAGLVGSAAVIFETMWNNVVGMDNAVVDGAEDMRLVAVRNEGAEAVEVFVELTADAVSNGYSVAPDVADHLGSYRDSSWRGDGYVDSRLVWETTDAQVSLGTLAAGGLAGFWLRRTPDGTVGVEKGAGVVLSYGGREQAMGGRFRASNPALVGYALYVGVDTEADVNEEASEVFAALPHETAALDPDHEYHFVVGLRNAYGLWSYSEESILDLDAAGAEVLPAPSAPSDIYLTQNAGGVVEVTAVYRYLEDGDNAANGFKVRYELDGDPVDLVTSTSAVVAFYDVDGVGLLRYNLPAAAVGSVVNVLVRSRRSSDGVESTNTTEVSLTVSEIGAGESGLAWQGQVFGSDDEIEIVWEGDSDNYVGVYPTWGVMVFVVGGVAVAGIDRARRLALSGELILEDCTTNLGMADDFEIGSGGELLIGVNGQRVATLDGSGNLRIAEAREDSSLPVVDGVFGDWIRSGATLDFSVDGARKALYFEDATLGAVYQGRVVARRIRTNA
jgi:hypothetical protein